MSYKPFLFHSLEPCPYISAAGSDGEKISVKDCSYLLRKRGKCFTVDEAEAQCETKFRSNNFCHTV